MSNSADYQRGAALIVGLVLLMVLTVLAISAMRTATLDLTMASNSQFRENAFQLAESGIQTIVRRAESGAINLDDPVAVPDCPPPPVAPQQIWDAAALPWQPAVVVPALQGRYETRICQDGETTDIAGHQRRQADALPDRVARPHGPAQCRGHPRAGVLPPGRGMTNRP